jgi:tetratricopeptide (TPR) repeat protein
MNGLQQIAKRLTGLTMRRSGISLGIWGEPGIGKTHAALALLRGTSCQSLSVHTTQALEMIVRQIPRPKKISVWLERSLERLEAGEPLETGVFIQTLGALLTTNAPMILHVEDLHESTPDRLEVWQQLALAVTRIRGVGLIATSRAQPPDGFEVIRLEPLNRAASDALLEAEAGTVLPVEACSWIFEHACGNPLFTLEFFRFLARHGFVWNDSQRWRWRVPEHQVMPVTVEAIIERAISEACADTDTRTALEARAYLESLEPNLKLEPAVWAHVASLEPDALERAVLNLRAQGVLNESTFVHPLFREVPVKGLNPRDRKSFASHALEVLPLEVAAVFIADAQLGSERSLEFLEWAALAATEAGNPIKAARFQAQAVEHARGEVRARLALASAQVLRTVDFAQASRLADLAALEPTLASQAIMLGAELLAMQGRLTEAEGRLEVFTATEPLEGAIRRLKLYAMARDFIGALELWQQNPELQASVNMEVLQAAIQTLLSTDHYEEARTVLGQAQTLQGLSPADRTALDGFEANLCAHDGETERAATLYASRADKLLASGDLRQAAIALKNHGVTMERLGRFCESSNLYGQAAQRFAELGDLRRVADAKSGVAWNLWHLGEYEDAETIFLESIDLQRGFEPTDQLVFCEGCLSLMYLDWSPPLAIDLANKHARTALEVARQLGNATDIVDSLFDNVLVRLRQGRPGEARVLAEEMTSLCETHGLSGTAITAMYCQALVLEAEGNVTGALRLMTQSETEHQGSEMFKTKIGMEIARLSGDLERARRHLDWFEARGVVNGVNVLCRYFPELSIKGFVQTSGPAESKPIQRLEVLGMMQLWFEETITPMRGSKRKELLALLLEARIMGRSELSRLHLFDALYPDSNEAQANAALSSLVYQLRELCGPNTILSSDGGYALGGITSDAETFLESGNTRLWRGAYLEGSDLGVGETVRETLHLALRNRAESLLETDPNEVVRVGRLMCSADPYDLESLRLTLRALRASDNHKSLKSTYARARTDLLEIGEVLPERWTDFLEPPTGKTA